MKNIELKVKVDDFRNIERSLREMGAKFCGNLHQRDIYYNSPKGRLKIREINNNTFELIYYQRPDKLKFKLSSYFIIPLTKIQLKQLKNILKSMLDIKVIVVKSRRLWLFNNTRIHLDKVDKLGKFLELETVLKKMSKSKGEKEYLKIFNLLELGQFEMMEKSYSDLLLM